MVNSVRSSSGGFGLLCDFIAWGEGENCLTVQRPVHAEPSTQLWFLRASSVKAIVVLVQAQMDFRAGDTWLLIP